MSMLKRIAGKATAKIAKQANVTHVERLSKHILRVRIEGEQFDQLTWSPGDKIKLHVGDGNMRSYTPAQFNPTEKWMDLIFHLHGNGPASEWASSLKGGEETYFMGPAKSMASITTHRPWTMFFGDETTIGLAQALKDALPTDVEMHIAIELEAEDQDALKQLPISMQPIVREGIHGTTLLQHAKQLTIPEGDGAIWLSGEANTVLSLRTFFLSQGLERSQLLIKPYWSIKGKADRKQLERTQLKN